MRALSTAPIARLLGPLLVATMAATAAGQDPPVLPTPARIWQGDDYVTIAEGITSQRIKLPRLVEGEGGATFRRLVDRENLDIVRDKSLPAAYRLQEGMKVFKGISDIGKAYISRAQRDTSLHPEMAEIIAFMMHAGDSILGPTDEVVKDAPRDETYPARMKGLDQMKQGLAQVYLGAEQSLHETDFYKPQDLSKILDAMAETLPRAKTLFPTGFGQELRTKLKADRRAFSGDKERKLLDQMVAELGS